MLWLLMLLLLLSLEWPALGRKFRQSRPRLRWLLQCEVTRAAKQRWIEFEHQTGFASGRLHPASDAAKGGVCRRRQADARAMNEIEPAGPAAREPCHMLQISGRARRDP